MVGSTVRWLAAFALALFVGGWGCASPQVLDVLVSDNPSMVLEKQFTVALSTPSALAVKCTRDDRPDEIHLVESTEPATEHVLNVQGLVADADYTCVVAPVDVAEPAPSEGVFSTSSLPSSIPSATAVTSGEPGAAYTLMPHQRLILGETSIRLVLMDDDGEVRWYYPLPIEGWADMGAEYWGDGLFLWGGVGDSEAGDGAPRLVDVSHTEHYHADYPGAADSNYHHSSEQQYDGTVVTLVEAEASIDGDEVYGFEVQRVDVQADELVWSWHVQQALDQGVEVGDANWAGVMPHDDGSETLVISVCEGAAVIGVDVASGDVAWSLAEWGSLDLTEGEFPDIQHGLDIDGEHILLYDNGAVPTTRAVEYAIDAAAGTATQTWAWTEDGFNEAWGWGDVDYLGDDHVVIAKGHVPDWEGEGPSEVIEVDRTDDSVAWRLSFSEEEDAIYSADRIGGCDLFTETSRCPALAARLDELSPWFEEGDQP